MKRIFIALLVSASAQASALQIKVSDFNFEYRDPRGDGVASSFHMDKQREAQSVAVLVDKVDDNFSITVSGAQEGRYELKGAPSFMTEAKSMHIVDLDLSFDSEANLSVASASFVSDDELSLRNFTLSCARSQAVEVMDQLLEGCIQKMRLRSNKFSSNSLTTLVQKTMGGIGVNDLDLNVSGGKLDLSAQIKAQISGKARAKGNISYAAHEKKLTVKLSEVKFGILNVTSQVFDELKKNESAQMKVQKPYIYLFLN